MSHTAAPFVPMAFPDKSRLASALLSPALAGLFLGSCATQDAYRSERFPPLPRGRPVIQSVVGITALNTNDVLIDSVSTSEPSAVADVEYSNLPTAGVVGMQPLTQGSPHVGVEAAAIFGWWLEDADVYLPGGGSVVANVDTSLWLTDLSLGPYVSTSMNRNVRFYGGAGGAVVFAFLNVDSTDTETDLDASAAGVGVYARAGVEFLLRDGSFLGLGLRTFQVDLDFDSGLPDADFDGYQVFMTYSVGTGSLFAPPRNHWH